MRAHLLFGGLGDGDEHERIYGGAEAVFFGSIYGSIWVSICLFVLIQAVLQNLSQGSCEAWVSRKGNLQTTSVDVTMQISSLLNRRESRIVDFSPPKNRSAGIATQSLKGAGHSRLARAKCSGQAGLLCRRYCSRFPAKNIEWWVKQVLQSKINACTGWCDALFNFALTWDTSTTPAASKSPSSSLDESNCFDLFLDFVVSAAAATGLLRCAALAASPIPSSFALAAPLTREASLAILASACSAIVGIPPFLLPPGCLPPESVFLDPLPSTLGILQDHWWVWIKMF